MGALIARLPGAIVLMPQELKLLSRDECESRLCLEAESYKPEMSDDEIRWLLERCLGRKYCECFVPAMAAAILAYLSLAAILPSDGYALVALAAVPAPMILARGHRANRGRCKADR
mmetsp:Transcript_77695/g.171629  ORF Transcript_77695/g.171629 Transcript_77695/m.171629 type:complete len:116 (-) Transcript_77695:30-377(-)